MKKALLGVALLTLTAWARPYRDGICEAEFPGAFSKTGHVASLALPHLQLSIISWTTPPEEAIAMLGQLYQHSSYRGVECEFVNRQRAQGLQLVESLPLQRTQSQFFVTSGVCYEIRACSDDQGKPAEIEPFFASIRFRSRTVNLKQRLTGGPQPIRYVYPSTAPSPPPRPANPYEF
ncbi:hypothetical protein JST97_11450 [bacterium]|nr:hypothetical protein [bacterium]